MTLEEQSRNIHHYNWRCPALGYEEWGYGSTSLSLDKVAVEIVRYWSNQTRVTVNNVEVHINDDLWMVLWDLPTNKYLAVKG